MANLSDLESSKRVKKINKTRRKHPYNTSNGDTYFKDSNNGDGQNKVNTSQDSSIKRTKNHKRDKNECIRNHQVLHSHKSVTDVKTEKPPRELFRNCTNTFRLDKQLSVVLPHLNLEELKRTINNHRVSDGISKHAGNAGYKYKNLPRTNSREHLDSSGKKSHGKTSSVTNKKTDIRYERYFLLKVPTWYREICREQGRPYLTTPFAKTYPSTWQFIKDVIHKYKSMSDTVTEIKNALWKLTESNKSIENSFNNTSTVENIPPKEQHGYYPQTKTRKSLFCPDSKMVTALPMPCLEPMSTEMDVNETDIQIKQEVCTPLEQHLIKTEVVENITNDNTSVKTKIYALVEVEPEVITSEPISVSSMIFDSPHALADEEANSDTTRVSNIDQPSSVSRGAYKVDWSILFTRNLVVAKDLQYISKLDFDSKLYKVFMKSVENENLYNGGLFKNGKSIPSGVFTTALTYKMRLLECAREFQKILSTYLHNDDPTSFLNLAFHLSDENPCVYAFCLLRLLLSLTEYDSWINRAMNYLGILYYINPGAYESVMNTKFDQIEESVKLKFLSTLKKFNESNLEEVLGDRIPTDARMDVALRKLLCCGPTLGNGETLLSFADREVLSCQDIMVLWVQWSSTDPKIKINTPKKLSSKCALVVPHTAPEETTPVRPPTRDSVQNAQIFGKLSTQSDVIVPEQSIIVQQLTTESFHDSEKLMRWSSQHNINIPPVNPKQTTLMKPPSRDSIYGSQIFGGVSTQHDLVIPHIDPEQSTIAQQPTTESFHDSELGTGWCSQRNLIVRPINPEQTTLVISPTRDSVQDSQMFRKLSTQRDVMVPHINSGQLTIVQEPIRECCHSSKIFRGGWHSQRNPVVSSIHPDQSILVKPPTRDSAQDSQIFRKLTTQRDVMVPHINPKQSTILQPTTRDTFHKSHMGWKRSSQCNRKIPPINPAQANIVQSSSRHSFHEPQMFGRWSTQCDPIVRFMPSVENTIVQPDARNFAVPTHNKSSNAPCLISNSCNMYNGKLSSCLPESVVFPPLNYGLVNTTNSVQAPTAKLLTSKSKNSFRPLCKFNFVPNTKRGQSRVTARRTNMPPFEFNTLKEPLNVQPQVFMHGRDEGNYHFLQLQQIMSNMQKRGEAIPEEWQRGTPILSTQDILAVKRLLTLYER